MLDNVRTFSELNFKNHAPKRKSISMIRREQKQLDAADQLLVIELAKSGLFAYKIAVKFDVTAHRIKAICSAAGVDLMSRENQKNKRAKQILAMLQNGNTTEQILNQVDCDRELIAQVRHRNGFSIPPSVAQQRASKAAQDARKLVSDGMTVVEACKCVKISPRTYSKYKKAADGKSAAKGS